MGGWRGGGFVLEKEAEAWVFSKKKSSAGVGAELGGILFYEKVAEGGGVFLKENPRGVEAGFWGGVGRVCFCIMSNKNKPKALNSFIFLD